MTPAEQISSPPAPKRRDFDAGQTSGRRGGMDSEPDSGAVFVLSASDPRSDSPDHPMSNLIGGHDEWLTPPEILSALGQFDLDPCAPVARPWPTAGRHFTRLDNGLRIPWSGRVWLNPPYGTETGKWLGRLAEHGNGIALIFARTETEMFFRHVWPKAHAIFFFEGRLHFYRVDGTRATANAGAPSCLIAYGANNAEALAGSGIAGKLIPLSPPQDGLGFQGIDTVTKSSAPSRVCAIGEGRENLPTL